MDALPGNETSGLPYACSTGAVHACGHDIHTSMLLGAAKLLQAHRHELHGRVVLMFQPGEECLCGALGMVQDGLLDCFRPQLALAMHVNVADVPRGQVWSKQGGFNAASDIFEVMVSGRRGHGAHPGRGECAGRVRHLRGGRCAGDGFWHGAGPAVGHFDRAEWLKERFTV